MRRIVWLALLAFALPAQGVDDPMKPPGQVEPAIRGAVTAKRGAAESGFSLTSVVISAESRSAIINGTYVKVGDSVGGYRVTEIYPTHVRLQRDKRELVVNLLPLSVKQRPTARINQGNEKQEDAGSE